MTTHTVTCQSCGETWRLPGPWSSYESEATESRPCPHCDAYTLSSPEPTASPAARRAAPWSRRPSFAGVELACRVG